ncbi:cytochrome c551 [Methylopila jiangsuensis]|uniref:Cytochrome c551 n=1 Tax=Methylopila jiangsuensis TaxID=586230 RepID=A0A9W6JH98_9HYPH|nr:cation transporter [Methylopila jiangsuensis]MDR6285982.1 putative Co/Zn/Cd cation transporter (cation efflux family) [Methylopila jiangsuensis]GLK75739.1 cytochrome c551 [Methylopila jiangsuensis]
MTAAREQHVLKVSIAATVLIGAIGVAFGMLSGSLSILFDGVFGALDAAMTGLSLLVSRLIAREASQRFQMGFWHLEPLVLAVNGGLLTVICFYAFVSSVTALFSGGHELAFDWALIYACVVTAICFGMLTYVRRANRSIGSALIALDVKSWLMSCLISLALLLAFGLAFLLSRAGYEDWTRYADPALLAILTAGLMPAPASTVIAAVKEILLVAPEDLHRDVREAAEAAAGRHGFLGCRTYVAKVGRSRVIEIYLIAAPDRAVGSFAELDAIRAEIGAAIGGEGRDRWLTIAFTADPKWAD